MTPWDRTTTAQRLPGPSADAAAPPSTPAVAVRDLVKLYRAGEGGTLRAVDGVSFEVRQGKVFGLVGPNGRRQDHDARARRR
jgi:ABC-type glutathione transport system ATPase component